MPSLAPPLRVWFFLVGMLASPALLHAQASDPYRAAREGDLDRLRLALQSGFKINQEDPRGFILLHYAARGGHAELVQWLLDHGANVHERTRFGATALHFAAAGGHLETAEILIRHGADPDVANQEGQTPLIWAATAGQEQLAHWLTAQGATPSKQAELLLAVIRGSRDRVRELLDQGVSVNTVGKDGLTPVFLAAQTSHLEMVNLLLERGANLRRRVFQGQSVLHSAATPEIARRLMAGGLKPYESTRMGLYPLHTAAQRGRTAVVKFFIDQGAPVNLPTALHMTPLHYAAANGHEDTVRLLLKLGAAPGARTIRRKTPADLAREKGHASVVELLSRWTPPPPSPHQGGSGPK